MERRWPAPVPGRRRQRLRRQGHDRRQAGDHPAQGQSVQDPGIGHRRQHLPVRRHRRQAVRRRNRRRALRRAQLRFPCGGGRYRRPLLRIHDRRFRLRAGQDRLQLRLRHDRGLRLRPRHGQHFRRPREPRAGGNPADQRRGDGGLSQPPAQGPGRVRERNGKRVGREHPGKPG